MTYKKSVSYLKKTRKQKKLMYIRIKNAIRKNKTTPLRSFLTYDVIGKNSQWADIYFLSKKNGLFYNVTIETTKAAWHEEVEGRAMNEVLKEGAYNSDIFDKKVEEIIKKQIVFVQERVRILSGYQYGIGLEMVLNVENLTVDNINKAIESFINNEEREWVGSEKFSYPYKSEASYFVNALTI